MNTPPPAAKPPAPSFAQPGYGAGSYAPAGYGQAAPAPAPVPAPVPAHAAPAASAALSIDVGDHDFELEVLERSVQVPVLLDCWAPWCGPCKSLTPVLDKLVQAYAGRFVLAKLNTDDAPEISAAIGLRSIPLVMLFIGGQPVGQFAGALPEGQVRAFLDKHLPAAPLAPSEPEVAPPTPLDLAEGLIAEGQFDNAWTLLDSLDANENAARHKALSARLTLASTRPPGDVAELQARVAAQPKDFEARFALAALLAHAGDFGAAFEQLLDVVMRDKAEARETARKQLVAWFDACPDAAAVSRGRRLLGMYLN